MMKDNELEAIRSGIKHFHSFLYSTMYIIQTDHESLTYLLMMKDLDPRLARSVSESQNHTPQIKYKPKKKKKHTNTDVLSRILTHVVKDVDDVENESESPAVGVGVDAQLQQRRLLEIIVQGDRDTLFKAPRMPWGTGRYSQLRDRTERA